MASSFNGDYISAFSKFLQIVADYANQQGISSQNILITGHSLGAGAANLLRDNSTTIANGFFNSASFITFAAPVISSNTNILNFGFDNDRVFKVAEGIAGEPDPPNALNNIIFVNDSQFGSDGERSEFSGSENLIVHDKSLYEVAAIRLRSSEALPFLTRDTHIAIVDTAVVEATSVLANISFATSVAYIGSNIVDMSNTIIAGDGRDLIDGGGGLDFIRGGGGNDRIWGRAGADDIRGENGLDTILGGTEGDTIYGGPDNDSVLGEGGRDFLRGEAGADTISGGADADTIYGDGENDSLLGNEGDDSLIGGHGNDVIEGGTHILGDTVRYDYARNDYAIDAITGGFRVTANRGGEGTDTIRG